MGVHFYFNFTTRFPKVGFFLSIAPLIAYGIAVPITIILSIFLFNKSKAELATETKAL